MRISPASTSCSSATITTITWIYELYDGSRGAETPYSSFRLAYLGCYGPKGSGPSMNSIGVRRGRSIERRFTIKLGLHTRIGNRGGRSPVSVSDRWVAGIEVSARSSGCRIDRVPHRAYCHHCAKEFDVTNFVALCPTCEEWSSKVVSGTELQILDMEIETKQS